MGEDRPCDDAMDGRCEKLAAGWTEPKKPFEASDYVAIHPKPVIFMVSLELVHIRSINAS